MHAKHGEMGTQVILNIYDLHPCLQHQDKAKSPSRTQKQHDKPTDNKYVYWLGLGAFHAGVELDGTEWSFGYVSTDGTGVFSCEPRCAGGAVYRESMVMGTTSKTGWQIDNLLAQMKQEYPGRDYHMHLHNCVTFSDDLCFRLTHKHVPAWLNRLPRIAHVLRCCLPRYLRGPYPVFDDAGSDASDSPTLADERTPFVPPRGTPSTTATARLCIPRGDDSSHSVSAAAAKRLGIVASSDAADLETPLIATEDVLGSPPPTDDKTTTTEHNAVAVL